MKIPSDHPLAHAALHVVRNSFQPKDLDFRPYFDATVEDIDFDLHSDGAIILRPRASLEGRKKILTLSFKHHFKTIPVVNVVMKKEKIIVAAKAYPIPPAAVASEEGQKLAAATVKAMRSELAAKKS